MMQQERNFAEDVDHLTDRDLGDLADAMAMHLHNMMGNRVFYLQRADIVELIDEYICDLHPEDQQALCWCVWHLFQDARDMVMASLYDNLKKR